MQSLWNEVQNLKTTAKSWEIVTLRNNGGSTPYPFDSKYANWNFIVLSARGQGNKGYPRFSREYNRSWFATSTNQKECTVSWSKSGNSIVQNGLPVEYGATLTVLFYK